MAKLFFRSSFRLSSHRQLEQIGRSGQRVRERRRGEEAVTFGGSLTVCEKERGSAHSSAVFPFSVGVEWGPYHRFCRGIEFFLLLAWECKKRSRDRLKKGLMLPLPLPPLFCSSSASLECAKKRRDISGEAHLASSCSRCKIAQSFATQESRE